MRKNQTASSSFGRLRPPLQCSCKCESLDVQRIVNFSTPYSKAVSLHHESSRGASRVSGFTKMKAYESRKGYIPSWSVVRRSKVPDPEVDVQGTHTIRRVKYTWLMSHPRTFQSAHYFAWGTPPYAESSCAPVDENNFYSYESLARLISRNYKCLKLKELAHYGFT